jgi:hypothetical protein
MNGVFADESNVSTSLWVTHNLNYVPFYLAACSDTNIGQDKSTVKSYMFPKIKPSGSYPYDAIEDGHTENNSGVNSAKVAVKFVTGQNSIKSIFFTPDVDYG